MPTHTADSNRSLLPSSHEISLAQRAFFVVIAAAALFVAYLGLAAPETMDRSFTWAVLPPLHAGFIGVLYLFGGVYMVGCIAARRRAQVAAALPGIALFTSLLLLATLLNLEAFDFDLTPVWVWTLSYTIYPIVAVALAWSARGRGADAALLGGAPIAAWARTFLCAQAAAFACLGLALLIAPSAMVDVWPWPISAGLAQFYGGPFLAYAVCSGLHAGRGSWAELSAIAPAMFVFAAGTIVVSLAHSELFSASDPAAWAWFAGFAAAALATLVMSARALAAAVRAGRRAADPEVAVG